MWRWKINLRVIDPMGRRVKRKQMGRRQVNRIKRNKMDIVKRKNRTLWKKNHLIPMKIKLNSNIKTWRKRSWILMKKLFISICIWQKHLGKLKCKMRRSQNMIRELINMMIKLFKIIPIMRKCMLKSLFVIQMKSIWKMRWKKGWDHIS